MQQKRNNLPHNVFSNQYLNSQAIMEQTPEFINKLIFTLNFKRMNSGKYISTEGSIRGRKINDNVEIIQFNSNELFQNQILKNSGFKFKNEQHIDQLFKKKSTSKSKSKSKSKAKRKVKLEKTAGKSPQTILKDITNKLISTKSKKKQKKKSKKSKKQKIAKQVQRIIEIQPPLIVQEDPIKPLINKTLAEFKSEKIQKIQMKNKREIEKMEKKKNLAEKNEEIRKINAERFGRRNNDQDFAWGVNQQKIKTYIISKLFREKDNLEPENRQKPDKKELELERRRRLGLEHLQEKREEEIKELLEKEKSKFLMKTSAKPLQKTKKVFPPDQQLLIRSYMENRKKKLEEEALQKLIEDYLKGEKIQENLKKLSSEVQHIFSNASNRTKFNMNKMTASRKSHRLIQNDNFIANKIHHHNNSHSSEGNNSYSQGFSFLEFECRKILKGWDSSNNKREENEKDNFEKKMEANSNRNAILAEESIQKKEDKRKNIREKFMALSNKFDKLVTNNSNNTLSINNLGGNKQEPKSPNFLQILNEEDEKSLISKENPLQSDAKIDRKIDFEDSKLEKQSNNESPCKLDPFIANASEIRNPNNAIFENKSQSLIKPIEVNEIKKKEEADLQASETRSKHISNLSEELDPEYINQEEEEENERILESIAIMIQKVWRGYRTRKILTDYFEQILAQREELDNYQNYPNENNYYMENEIIEEDCMEDRIESMHIKEQKRKKCRSEDYLFRTNNELHDDQKIMQDESKTHPSVTSDFPEVIVESLEVFSHSPRLISKKEEELNLKKELKSSVAKENSSLDLLTYKFNQEMKRLQEESEGLKPKLIKAEVSSQNEKDENDFDFKWKNKENNSSKSRISEMRLMLCSEEIIREHSESFSPLRKKSKIREKPGSLPSSPTHSIFEQSPYQEFAEKKIKEILTSDNARSFVEMRDKMLEKSKSSECASSRHDTNSPSVVRGAEMERWMEGGITEEKAKGGKKKGTLTIAKTKRDLALQEKMQQDGQFERSYFSETKNMGNTENESLLSQSWHSLNTKISNLNKTTKNEKIDIDPTLKSGESIKLSDQNENAQKKLLKTENQREIISLFNSNEVEKEIPNVDKEEVKGILCFDEKENRISNLILEDLIDQFINEIKDNPKFSHIFQEKIDEISPINTTILAIEEFVNLIGEVLYANEDLLNEFVFNINQAIDNDIFQKIKMLKNGLFDPNFSDFVIKPEEILPNKAYEIANNEIFMSSDPEISKVSQSCQTLIKIHNLAIFETFKEALEYFRPFDIRGKPCPWKPNSKKLTFTEIDENNLETVLIQAKAKVLEWSCFQCGLHLESLDGYMSYEEYGGMKMERMERAIENEILESIEKWTSYEDHENILKFEISELIFEDLIEEVLFFCER